MAIDPEDPSSYEHLGFAYYALGNFERARALCESKPDFWANEWCLAVAYDKLRRHADAEAQLARLKAAQGSDSAFQYAAIYAQWGKPLQALQWLETALRMRDPGLEALKVESLLDPLRREPRFEAVMRALKFPDRAADELQFER